MIPNHTYLCMQHGDAVIRWLGVRQSRINQEKKKKSTPDGPTKWRGESVVPMGPCLIIIMAGWLAGYG